MYVVWSLFLMMLINLIYLFCESIIKNKENNMQQNYQFLLQASLW